MDFVKSFSPGHVTGLFSIHDEGPDPLAKGSKGAGFCLSLGITTEIRLKNGAMTQFYLNKKHIEKNPLSDEVLDLFFQKTGLNRPGLEIYQTSALPVGSGFGTSGAGALSLALGLNHLFDSPLSALHASQIAHLAEIKCKTGLGTVLTETFGGFEIRTSPGAPGVGTLTHFPFDKDLRAVFLVFGPFSTPEVLKRGDLKEKINETGEKLRNLLEEAPSTNRFLELSQRFTTASGLLTFRLKNALDALNKYGFDGGMLMFGEGLFTLVPEHRVSEILQLWTPFSADAQCFESTFDLLGGRIVQSN